MHHASVHQHVYLHLSVDCPEGSVRLENGMKTTEGRVEVCFNGHWATVCSDEFTLMDGQVICNQLGFEGIIMLDLITNASYSFACNRCTDGTSRGAV